MYLSVSKIIHKLFLVDNLFVAWFFLASWILGGVVKPNAIGISLYIIFNRMLLHVELDWSLMIQKQSPRSVLRKRCFENMQWIIEITLPHRWSPVNMLHIFRTTLLRTLLDGCFWWWILMILNCSKYIALLIISSATIRN